MKIKCIDNKGNEWFKVGNVYKAWRDDVGALYSECELNSAYHGRDLNNEHGVFEMVEEEKSHPHADLILKYAMISQYDDKPWEHFEVLLDGEWKPMDFAGMHSAFNYRLKPQEPKIQVGQTWVSKEGVEVVINAQSNKDTVVFTFDVGCMTHRQLCSFDNFLQNFKLKENK